LIAVSGSLDGKLAQDLQAKNSQDYGLRGIDNPQVMKGLF
jgi:hypothetical protein